MSGMRLRADKMLAVGLSGTASAGELLSRRMCTCYDRGPTESLVSSYRDRDRPVFDFVGNCECLCSTRNSRRFPISIYQMLNQRKAVPYASAYALQRNRRPLGTVAEQEYSGTRASKHAVDFECF